MKQSDSLEFVAPGSLARPGIIGRIVRFALAVACLSALWQIIIHRAEFIDIPSGMVIEFALLMLMPLCILNYVVNIGLSKSWGRKPVIVSLTGIGILAAVSFASSGSIDSPILGAPLLLWLGYFYGHLGVSFLLAAVIATPGCEMRSIPELFGRVTGREQAEHHCPVAFITKIDAWEKKTFGRE